jgi:hypothetical protein
MAACAPARLQVEKELVSRCGRRMALVGFSATATGSNPDLDGPIREGLLAVEMVPAAWSVTDADLAGLPAAEIPLFLDVAELRLLESILQNCDEADQKQNSDEQDWGKFAADLGNQIEKKRQWLLQRYLFGVPRLDVGTLSLEFVEHRRHHPEDF